MSSTAELEQHIRFLRNAAPMEFERFRTMFAAYSRSVADNLVAATGDLQVAQGRAQQCMKLLRMFEEVKDG